ncbi:MAG: carboxymuconolactone decarboxylase family protein [Kocuria sp.]|nr:carboxymuconolactone decarboxylase family protein [Kocuria sp.]
MADHYHSPEDLKLLGELKNLAPEEFTKFAAFDAAIGREGGHIDPLNRELIAIGVALTTQCPYCLEVHTKKAKAAGATREQVVEAGMVAAGLRAGAAVTHTAMALRLFDEA